MAGSSAVCLSISSSFARIFSRREMISEACWYVISSVPPLYGAGGDRPRFVVLVALVAFPLPSSFLGRATPDLADVTAPEVPLVFLFTTLQITRDPTVQDTIAVFELILKGVSRGSRHLGAPFAENDQEGLDSVSRTVRQDGEKGSVLVGLLTKPFRSSTRPAFPTRAGRESFSAYHNLLKQLLQQPRSTVFSSIPTMRDVDRIELPSTSRRTASSALSIGRYMLPMARRSSENVLRQDRHR